jgi:hypothetical protein
MILGACRTSLAPAYTLRLPLPPPHQDPNPDDPLNKEAAIAFQDNLRRFETDVQRAIAHGHHIAGQYFPPCKAVPPASAAAAAAAGR